MLPLEMATNSKTRRQRGKREMTFLETIKELLDDLRRDVMQIKHAVQYYPSTSCSDPTWAADSWDAYGDWTACDHGYEPMGLHAEALLSHLNPHAQCFTPSIPKETLLRMRKGVEEAVVSEPGTLHTQEIPESLNLTGDWRSLPTNAWKSLYVNFPNDKPSFSSTSLFPLPMSTPQEPVLLPDESMVALWDPWRQVLLQSLPDAMVIAYADADRKEETCETLATMIGNAACSLPAPLKEWMMDRNRCEAEAMLQEGYQQWVKRLQLQWQELPECDRRRREENAKHLLNEYRVAQLKWRNGDLQKEPKRPCSAYFQWMSEKMHEARM